MYEVVVELTQKGEDALNLWINSVSPNEAPKHLREALRMLYRDFDSTRLGVSLALRIRTVDCKTPAELRQLAIEAMHKRKKTF